MTTTSIPKFNQYGLLPAGQHPASLAMITAVFGFNARREQLIESLHRCIKLMHEENLAGTLYVDGSFATDKPHPDDMELTLDVRGQSNAQQGLAILFHVKHNKFLKNMGIDWYPTLADNVGRDFTQFFQYAGEKTAAAKRCHPKEPKGILKLTKW